MKQSFIPLRLVLLLVILSNVAFSYLFFFAPEQLASIYQVEILDVVHTYLSMTVGALLFVFALGAMLAFVQPRKYGSIIIMLLLSHFSIFVIDVIILARGEMDWQILLPEMIYFLVISTALVRYYPLSEEPDKQEYTKKEAEVVEPEVLPPEEPDTTTESQ